MINIFQLTGFSLIKYLIAGFVIALVLAIHPGNAQASSLDIPLNIKDCIKALPPGYTEPLFSGLGNHKYPTLTETLTETEELKSKKAKDYFNQGMTLLYAFNHPEAIHSFNQAAKYEPEAAMPYWGIAMAAGPDINTGATDGCLNLAYEAVNLAQKKAKTELETKVELVLPQKKTTRTELETKIIKALAQRYKRTNKVRVFDNAKEVERPNPDDKFNPAMCVDAQGDKVYVNPQGKYVCVDAIAYAKAMEKLYQKDQSKVEKNDDVATLYAAAEMNINPWKWWNKDKPTEQIVNALKVLTKVLYDSPEKVQELLQIKSLEGNSLAENEVHRCKLGDDQIPKPKSDHIGANHLGGNHYFIHATEESPCPKVALPSADRISELAPAAGHIQHMPSHVYQRIGKYAKATEANYKALYVDRAYIRQTPETARYPLHYLSHNLHFLTDSLSIQGRESEALAAAQQLFENTKEYSWNGYNPLHNQTLVQAKDDYFFTVPIWTAIRFNAWDFLSKIKCEEALFEFFTQRDLPFTNAMQSYGQVLKYLATTRHVTREDALAKLEEFWEEVGQADPKLQYGNNNASDLFRIANLVLVARTLEALPSEVYNDFIEKVKNRVEKYSVLKPDSNLFEGVIERDQRIIKIWKKAVELEKGLNYNEPPDWYYPVRESLGAAYYRQEKYEDAKKEFCKDLQIDNCENLKSDEMNGNKNLKIHKMNGRSLFGLIMSLEELKKQNEKPPQTEFYEKLKGDIEKLCEKFKKAWKNAPVKPSLKMM